MLNRKKLDGLFKKGRRAFYLVSPEDSPHGDMVAIETKDGWRKFSLERFDELLYNREGGQINYHMAKKYVLRYLKNKKSFMGFLPTTNFSKKSLAQRAYSLSHTYEEEEIPDYFKKNNRLVLDTRKNKFNEEVAVDMIEVHEDSDGYKFYRKTLDCQETRHLGLGECFCHNERHKVFRKYLESLGNIKKHL